MQIQDIQGGYINSININAGSDFPYLVLHVVGDQSYPRNPGFQVMHWHEDLQFIYVLDGAIEIKTLSTSVAIGKGSGAFINKNIVHLVQKNRFCHYNSFIFPDYFLKFYFGSPARSFVENIVENKQLSIYPFFQAVPGCSSALSILKKLSELENNKTEFYVYQVLVLLSQLWLAFCENLDPPKEKVDVVLNTRMQKFLQYISEHYSEDISLDMLSKSAGVSKSECLRCFKISMQTTPYHYLLEFRLAKAAELLKNSSKPICEISEQVGFHQQSYFGKCFRQKTGNSPREYRKKMNEPR